MGQSKSSHHDHRVHLHELYQEQHRVQFGVQHSIVSDNGKQFDNAATQRFCDDLGIQKGFSAPIYPESNGQVEAVNKILKYALKKKLDDLKEKWAEELRIVAYDEDTNTEAMNGELDLLEVRRLNSQLRPATYQ